jgi:fructose-1-phosphate kinase PfkB-like protein
LIQEDETGNTYAVYEPGQSVEPEEVESLMACFEALLRRASLVLLCGSGQGLVLAPVFARMIEGARASGVRCILDSSGEALALAIPARPYMVKVNVHELSSCLGYSLDSRLAQIDALGELHSKGVQLAALSRGEEGMLATDGVQTWEGVLRMERVVNVVGCGDSLLAGVAQATLKGADLSELVRSGVAFGTANTQVRGAGFIDAKTVEALLPKVDLRPVHRGPGASNPS